MSTIRERHGHQEVAGDVRLKRQVQDGEIKDLVKSILKDRERIAELTKVDVKSLSSESQVFVAKLVAQELRGQLPHQVVQQLVAGHIVGEQLQGLVQRLVNAASPD